MKKHGRQLSSAYPGTGPAAITRDPLLSIPLRENPRWRALSEALEAQITANQSVL